jgi:hypothetical protein
VDFVKVSVDENKKCVKDGCAQQAEKGTATVDEIGDSPHSALYADGCEG